MASLESRLQSLAQHIATVAKNLKVKQGDLSTLTTTEKNTIVGAINELKTSLGTLDTDINTRINTAIANALEGEDLSDLADQILALVQADQGLVSATSSQSFTDPQKAQARSNIGSANQTDLTTLTNNIGNTDHDFVSDFNSIYNA